MRFDEYLYISKICVHPIGGQQETDLLTARILRRRKMNFLRRFFMLQFPTVLLHTYGVPLGVCHCGISLCDFFLKGDPLC